MDWDISGIPRSWLLKTPLQDVPKLLSVIALRLGGVRPCFFMHVAPKPRNRALVIEKEVTSAYYRMARSLELQPGIKAIVAAAWFYDPAALRDNAHLEYLQRPFRYEGGLLTTIGPAPMNAGFLERNAKRRQQYEAGELQYRIGLAISASPGGARVGGDASGTGWVKHPGATAAHLSSPPAVTGARLTGYSPEDLSEDFRPNRSRG